MSRIPAPTSRPAGSQEQFLTILSRDEALARFEAALFPRAIDVETCTLAAALGRALAEDVRSPTDVPPFDRSNVDGFAVRAGDLVDVRDNAPTTLALNAETIGCGTAPRVVLQRGTATAIATGGPIPRGADAVVMIEQTDPDGAARIRVRRAATPGQFVSHAGSDIARGELILRRGTLLGSREIGMLAACGIADVPVARRLRIAVLSTGDELVAPGQALRPAAIYDANGPIICAAIAENGAEPVFLGAVADDEVALERAMRAALADHDALILSGGTSKGEGDLSHRIVPRLGAPGILAHGVALKPGKPLCLAVCDGKPVVVLPGFPTSAMFTFHDMVVPVLRRLGGLPPRSEGTVSATLPVRLPSELGRTEFAMVSLVEGANGLVAYPTGKGSGAVTSFAQADGFVTIAALADHRPAGDTVQVELLTPSLRIPDLVVVGSHCTGLDSVLGSLANAGLQVRTIAVGSLGGLAAARRGECDVAPIHLLDPASATYNEPFLDPGLTLVPGWRRMQGFAFRSGDPRFEGQPAALALATALADPACLMVNRNQGSGTRILLDGLLKGARPDGYWNQPRSHTAVAAAIVQGRADWGITIEPVAAQAGLGFLPIAEEHYDFALPTNRLERPAVVAFLAALKEPANRQALQAAGFSPV